MRDRRSPRARAREMHAATILAPAIAEETQAVEARERAVDGSLTKDEIKAYLDEREIAYPSSATKDELIALAAETE